MRDAKAAGVVVDWEQIDPVYKKDIAAFLNRFADALHDDDKELWLCVQPGEELDYIDFDDLSDNVDRFVALLFDETSDIDPPGPLGSRRWFEGWLNVLLEDADPKQWIIALGSYGYDWTDGVQESGTDQFSGSDEPRKLRRGCASRGRRLRITIRLYYYEDADKEHTVWFLDVVTFLNQLRAVRDTEGGWLRALSVRHGRRRDLGRAESCRTNFNLEPATRAASRGFEGNRNHHRRGRG